MNKIIAVCIQDENRFFALGIQQILLAYFQRHGRCVRFVCESEAASADLVFCAVRKGWPLQLCRYWVPGKPEATVHIAICATQSDKT